MTKRSVTLVTGDTGLLGPYLLDAARRVGDARGVSRHSSDIAADVTDSAAFQQAIERLSPDTVIHTAALTDVDRCEADPVLADRMNHLAVAAVADALPPEVRFVLISTDQVYPDDPGPHREDGTGPVNAYGRSKLAGEQRALSRERSLVCRVNFFGPSRTAGRESLSDFIVGRLQRGDALELFRDVRFSPLHVETLAATVFACIAKDLRGVYNIGCRRGGTKAEFGLAIAQHLSLSTGNTRVVDSAAIPDRAPRPHDLRMAVDRVEAELGYDLPDMMEEVSKL